ncbi:zinc finger protein OZF-like [Salarias fasciatus]|uniref:zinc finger protein OZF-like n=1 Tax=Salarias fasciatus TaxID=181472 RepID=UPI0011765923|nr:zinc finger protein OZF-like [Salarias fasciatus]
MSSGQALREFINERLTAAAGEIFTVFQQTIVQYEEEIDRQRRLLEMILKPQIKLHRIAELPRHHGCREEQLFKQEANYCPEQREPEPPQTEEEQELRGLVLLSEKQKEPEPPQIKAQQQKTGLQQFKEEHEEPEPLQTEMHEEAGTSQEGQRQIVIPLQSDSFKFPSIKDESYLSEPEEVSETEQFLSQDSEVHHVKKHRDSESAVNAELKEIGMFHSDVVENLPESEKQDECGKLPCEETCGEIIQKKHETCQNLGTVNPASEKNTEYEKLKEYSCKICGDSFRQHGNLMTHMKIHRSEKPHPGETCDRSLSQLNCLTSHMKSHTGEKPYSCLICGKSSSSNSSLRIHMRVHTGDKPYSCLTCGELCSERSSLLRHLKTHKGMKS